MSEPFIGEIRMIGFTFAPRGWAFCNGQELSIAQNTALFSLLGTTYGGDGRTTFALPDLRSRVPAHPGSDPIGLTPRSLGEQFGSETVGIPGHSHTLEGSDSDAASDDPTGRVPARPRVAGRPVQTYADTGNVEMASTGVVAGNGSQDNHQPSLGINFVIALTGVFPSRT